MNQELLYPYTTLTVEQSVSQDELKVFWHAIDTDAYKEWYAHDEFPLFFEEFALRLEQRTVLAVRLDLHMAGLVCAAKENWPVSCYASLLYVMPEFRSRHALVIGKALVHAATDILQYENIFTTTHPKHLAARAYNLALGFHHVGVLPGEARFHGEAVDLELYSLRPPRQNRGQEWRHESSPSPQTDAPSTKTP